MRLADLSIPELLDLANVLLTIADDATKCDKAAAQEAVEEIKYILRLVTEKGEQSQGLFARVTLN